MRVSAARWGFGDGCRAKPALMKAGAACSSRAAARRHFAPGCSPNGLAGSRLGLSPRCRHAAGSKVHAQQQALDTATAPTGSSVQAGSRRGRIAVSKAARALKLRLPAGSKSAAARLLALLQQPGQHDGPEGEARLLLLLQLGRASRTEDLTQALTQSFIRSQADVSAHFNWQLAFAAVRLLGERRDLTQVLSSSQRMEGLCAIMEGLMARGIQPRCSGFFTAAQALLTSPSADLTMDQQVSILTCLAAMPQRHAVPMDSLIAITQQITAVAAFQHSMQATPGAVNVQQEAQPAGTGAAPSPLARAVGALCWILRQQRTRLLQQQEAAQSAAELQWAVDPGASQQSMDSLDDEQWTNSRAGSGHLSVSEALEELCAACSPLSASLGPQVASSLVQTCGLLGAGTAVATLQAFLSEAEAATSAVQQLWSRAIGRGLASLDATASPEVVQSLAQRLTGLADSKGEEGRAGSVAQLLAEELREQLYQQHSEGQATCSPTGAAALAQALSAAFSSGRCGVDAVASAACCLTESLGAQGGTSSGAAGSVLQELLDKLQAHKEQLSTSATCDVLAACLAAGSEQGGTLQSLQQHAVATLTSQPLDQVPARSLVALLSCTASAGPSSNVSTSASSAQLASVRARCYSALAARPLPHLLQQLGSARKLQLMWAMLAWSSEQAQVLPTSEAGVTSSGQEADRLLDSALYCGAAVCHLLAPGQVTQLLQRLSLCPTATSSTTTTTTTANSLQAAGSGRAVLLPRLSTLMLSSLDSFSDSQLLYCCRSLAALRYRPGLLLRDMCVRLLPLLPDLPFQSGVWLMWSLATLRLKKPISRAVARACLASAQRQAAESMRNSSNNGASSNSNNGSAGTSATGSARAAGEASTSMDAADFDDLGPTPAQLAVLVWACGRLGFREDALLKPTLQRLIRTSGRLSLRLVSHVVWACARLGYSTERLSAWATSHLAASPSSGPASAPASASPSTSTSSPPESLASLSAQTLSNLCWGLWRLGHQPSPQVLALLTSAAARYLSAGMHTQQAVQQQEQRQQQRGNRLQEPGVAGDDVGHAADLSYGLKAKELTALLSALACWGAVLPAAALNQVEARIAAAAAQLQGASSSSSSGGGEASPSSTSAAASNGTSSNSTDSATARFSNGSSFDANGFNVHMLAGCVWALVTLQHRPSPRTLTLVSGAVQHLLLRWQQHRSSTAGPTAQTASTSPSSSPSSSPGALVGAPESPSNAPDELVGDFLHACFQCGFSPQPLLDTYSNQLQHRLEAAYGSRLQWEPPQLQAASTQGQQQGARGSRGAAGASSPSSSGRNGTARNGTAPAARGRTSATAHVAAGVRAPASSQAGATHLPTPGASGLSKAALALGLHRAAAGGSGAGSNLPGSALGKAAAAGAEGVRLAKLLEAAAMAVPHEPGLTVVQLSRLLHGMALLGHCPRTWFAWGLPRLLRRLLPQMSAQQLAHTASALAAWPLQQLLRYAEWHHLLHRCLGPVLEARLGADAAAGAQAAATRNSNSGAGPSSGSNSSHSSSNGASTSSSSVPGAVKGRSKGAPASTSALLFLINAMATLGVYRRPAADTVLSWLMQRGERPWERRSSASIVAAAATAGDTSSESAMTFATSTSSTSTSRNGDANGSSSANVSSPAGAAPVTAPLPLYRLESVGSRDLVYLAWSLGRLKHDHPEALQAVGQLLLQRCSMGSTSTSGHNGAASSGAGVSIHASAVPTHGAPRAADRLSPGEVTQLLWAWAKLNRNPGPQLLDELHRQWQAATHSAPAPSPASTQRSSRAATQGASAAATPPRLRGGVGSGSTGVDGVQYHELTVVLYSLAVLRQHAAPLAVTAAEQLADKLAAHQQRMQQQQQQQQGQQEQGQGSSAPWAGAGVTPSPGPGSLVLMPRIPPELRQQLRQIAAVLLAAQADRTVSPLSAALPAEVKAAAIAAWRDHVASKAAKKANGHQREVASAAERLGLLPQLGTLTPDGVASPDVLVGLPQSPSARFALELVGPHNSAANGMRLLGDATIKYRLLQARGYIVIPIPCAEWDALGEQGAGAKALYLQNKLDRVIEVAAAAKPSQVQGAASAVPVVPVPEAVRASVGPGVDGKSTGGLAAAGEGQEREGKGDGEEGGFTRTVLAADGGKALQPWNGSAARRVRQPEQQQQQGEQQRQQQQEEQGQSKEEQQGDS